MWAIPRLTLIEMVRANIIVCKAVSYKEAKPTDPYNRKAENVFKFNI